MTTTDLDLLKAEVARLERDLSDVKAKIRRMMSTQGGSGAGPFAELRGILNDVHFTEDEIESAKVRSRDAEA